MKKSKKIIAMGMTLALMAGCFVGCGNDDTKPANNNSNNTQTIFFMVSHLKFIVAP